MAAPLYRREGSLDFTRTPSSSTMPVVLPPVDDRQHQHQQQERLLKGSHNKEQSQVPTPESRALYAACSEGAGLAKVEAFLAKGANANWYNNQKGGETALHAASRHTGAEAARVVAALIGAGAQPGVVSLPEFNTPLHLAAAAGNLGTVKLLIEWHVKETAVGSSASDGDPPASPALVLRQANAYGNTPLHEAAINGHDDVVAYLFEMDDRAGSDSDGATTAAATSAPTTRLIDIPNKRGSTPLLFALYGARAPAPLVERLLARGADPGQTDHDRVGVLHVCASQGHQHLLPLFLARFRAQGLDVAAVAARQDANGHDPAFYARMKGHPEIVRLLEEAAGPEEKNGAKA